MMSLVDYIFEFAEAKREEKRRITDKADIVIEHLIMLIYEPDNINAAHWRQELFGFLKQLVQRKLKTDNRQIRYKLFNSVFVDTVLDMYASSTVKRHIISALLTHTNLTKYEVQQYAAMIYNFENVTAKLKRYINKLSDAYADSDVLVMYEIINDTNLNR